MNYTYPKNYKIKPIKEQLAILEKHFGKMPTQSASDSPENPKSEGLFAIPHYRLIATTYNQAVLRVMEIMKSTRPTYDYRSGKWTGQYLRDLPIKRAFWNAQKEEIILISAQFGLAHRGKSVKTVRTELTDNELPLGIYECLIMLLTHPERLENYNDLWIDCPGDEYSWDADGSFSKAPLLLFSDGKVWFGASDVSVAFEFFGSVSGFVPHVNLGTGKLVPSEPLTLESAIRIVKNAGYKITHTITTEVEI